MLRAYALADLFEANLDSTIAGIFLTTTGGNLIGLSPHMPPPLVKRLSVLGALTWRFHASASTSLRNAASVGTSVSSSSSPSAVAAARVPGAHDSVAASAPHSSTSQPAALPVLRTARGSEDEGLREMVVECDDRICAFEYVREGLLVGAVSEELQSRKEDGDETRMNGGVGESGATDDDSASEGREPAENNADAEEERARRRDRWMRLLVTKASAMADYLREELREFKMPTGLE